MVLSGLFHPDLARMVDAGRSAGEDGSSKALDIAEAFGV
jgi:hypothetical protein